MSPGNPMSHYSISDLSKEFDLTSRAIRFYEDKGLLSPERIGTKRLYNRKDRARIKLIVRGKKLGFSLSEIDELIELYENKDDEVPQLLVYRDKLLIQLSKMEQQKSELERMIFDVKVAERECLATLNAKGIETDDL